MRRIFVFFPLLMCALCFFNSCDRGSVNNKSSVFAKSDNFDYDDEYEEQEAESGESDAEEETYNSLEAEAECAEGLAQVPYTQLEQPGPINGERETILFKNQFIISFNANYLCPFYVAWHLTKDRVKGNARRVDEFIPDYVLSESSRVETSDYYGSGYDRGHMCPAGDNKNDAEAMKQSFMMTNICPQNHELNSGIWNDLEQLCRQWVKDYGDLYVVCGPVFDGKNPKKIGKRKNMKIAVPDRFFKCVLMMGRTPKAIAFIFPNRNADKDLRDYCVSVDKVEKITGIDFFPKLDDSVEKRVEKECNPAAWGI